MKKILVTGFEPFGGEAINPSFEAVKNIRNTYADCEIITLEVPTAFYISSKIVIEKIHDIQPDFVIMVGQAGGRKEISVERVGLNIDDSKTPDNRGIKPLDNPISLFGENAYFSTLPIKEIEEKLRQSYIPVAISNSAGTYVCNHLLYSVLHELHEKSYAHIKAGFIHVPYIPEQTLHKQYLFSLDLDIITRALELVIETCLSVK